MPADAVESDHECKDKGVRFGCIGQNTSEILGPFDLEELSQEYFDQSDFSQSAHYLIESALAGHAENLDYLVKLYGGLNTSVSELIVNFRGPSFRQNLEKELEKQRKLFGSSTSKTDNKTNVAPRT